MRVDEVDPKHLMRESYRIAGITEAECRSIFLDWAISLPDGLDQRDALRVLLAEYGEDRPEHPMTTVLRAGLEAAPASRRRGGAAARARGGQGDT